VNFCLRPINYFCCSSGHLVHLLLGYTTGVFTSTVHLGLNLAADLWPALALLIALSLIVSTLKGQWVQYPWLGDCCLSCWPTSVPMFPRIPASETRWVDSRPVNGVDPALKQLPTTTTQTVSKAWLITFVVLWTFRWNWLGFSSEFIRHHFIFLGQILTTSRLDTSWIWPRIVLGPILKNFFFVTSVMPHKLRLHFGASVKVSNESASSIIVDLKWSSYLFTAKKFFSILSLVFRTAWFWINFQWSEACSCFSRRRHPILIGVVVNIVVLVAVMLWKPWNKIDLFLDCN